MVSQRRKVSQVDTNPPQKIGSFCGIQTHNLLLERQALCPLCHLAVAYALRISMSAGGERKTKILQNINMREYISYLLQILGS